MQQTYLVMCVCVCLWVWVYEHPSVHVMVLGQLCGLAPLLSWALGTELNGQAFPASTWTPEPPHWPFLAMPLLWVSARDLGALQFGDGLAICKLKYMPEHDPNPKRCSKICPNISHLSSDSSLFITFQLTQRLSGDDLGWLAWCFETRSPYDALADLRFTV